MSHDASASCVCFGVPQNRKNLESRISLDAKSNHQQTPAGQVNYRRSCLSLDPNGIGTASLMPLIAASSNSRHSPGKVHRKGSLFPAKRRRALGWTNPPFIVKQQGDTGWFLDGNRSPRKIAWERMAAAHRGSHRDSSGSSETLMLSPKLVVNQAA
jgi:hypothetical protein